MRIGVLGTGEVARTLATKLVEVGHDARLGSRTEDNEAAVAWADSVGRPGSHGKFADAAGFAEVIFNCTKGEYALAALEACAARNLSGKVLVDVTNPLDFSDGFPPRLTVVNTDSMAECIQRTYPDAKVVKALNTMWNGLMVNPRLIAEDHNTFLAGNDAEAKSVVQAILQSFGWRPQEIVDLGDITQARGLEMFLPLWVRLYGALGTGKFNVKLVKV